MKIYCCGCGKKVAARLTDGGEIYPHRPDLQALPFWKCDTCDGFVGCHHKTKNRTCPLGVIADKKMRNARKHIHAILDPLWKSGGMSRKRIYARLSKALGREYHTGEIRSIDEARKVYRLVQEIASDPS